jgi:hypothetical protein
MVLKCEIKFEIWNWIKNNYNQILKAALTNQSKFVLSHFKIPGL